MDYIQLISNAGFPITACIYLAVKFEKTLNKNTDVLNQLKEIIEKRIKKI